MKKLLATLTTVAMLATTTAFAAPIENNAGYNKTAGTYSVASDLRGQTGQLTLLIIPQAAYESDEIADKDILYIDQGAYAEGLFQSVGILGGTELEAGTYYAKIGGKNLTDGIIVEKFTIVAADEGTTFTVGDTNGSGEYNVADVTALISFIVSSVKFVNASSVVLPKPIGDTNGSGDINVADVTALSNYIVGSGQLTVEEYTLPAGVTAESTY